MFGSGSKIRRTNSRNPGAIVAVVTNIQASPGTQKAIGKCSNDIIIAVNIRSEYSSSSVFGPPSRRMSKLANTHPTLRDAPRTPIVISQPVIISLVKTSTV